jgi:rhodanese-related sulfurtransferase
VLRAIPTPGHTPEHLAYLLCEDGTPLALFSGGSLMVGTVGRTDLLGIEQQDELARRLFHALRDEILVLPDDLAVYPTHGAGSFCSAPGATERTTTIGRERATNPLLQVHDEDAFVDRLVAGFGTFPAYFGRLPEVNRHGPPLYETVPSLDRIDLAEFRREVAEGTLVVDVRPIEHFARGHVPGALSIALRPVFGSWLGWLVHPDRRLVFVLDEGQDRADLVRQSLNVGYEKLVGELDGGMDAWRAAGFAQVEHQLVAPDRVDGTVLDVRQRSEFDEGHLPEAVNVELGSLEDLVDQLPDGAVTLMCRHGERASTAASILEAHGRNDVRVLVGGPADCAAATGCRLE